MSNLFENSSFNGDISKWDVSNVKNMWYMFFGSKFNGDISNWNVSNVEKMFDMFSHSKFNGDLSKWKINTNNTTRMFSHNPLRDKWGANAELLRGKTLHLTSQEMVDLLNKMDSYIRKNYSSEFQKITDSEIIKDDPDLGVINIGIEDNYFLDKFGGDVEEYDEDIDEEDRDVPNLAISIDLWAEGYELSDTRNPAIEIGVVNVDDGSYDNCGYVEIDMDRIKESKYLEKKVDEAMKCLLDELR